MLPDMESKIKAARRTSAEATPVFPKAIHRLRPTPMATVATAKSKKRDDIFSKSRDTREDRGTREMKTSHNAQTFSHGR
jgi:hypothetical protein